MKFKTLVIVMSLVLVSEIILSTVFLLKKPDTKIDSVEANDIVKTITANWPDFEDVLMPSELDYSVISNDGISVEGTVLFASKEGLSKTLDEAIANRDTILNVIIENQLVGQIFIYNDYAGMLKKSENTVITILTVFSVIQILLLSVYIVYLNKAIIKPFKDLKGFAARVAGGDYDIPLNMDKHNMFGAFSESFDIMRNELKKARESEQKISESKKELVAKLSHDIKTPVASILAVSELWKLKSTTENDRKQFGIIESKADQINSLVTNLFNSTVQELHQLNVEPSDNDSAMINGMIKNTDYMGRTAVGLIPASLLYFDPIRLQQVIDNIITNSYKYADSAINITASLCDGFCYIKIEDYGGGVPAQDLPIIMGKFKRGGNSAGKDGVGLGLYISDYLMRQMQGTLEIANTSSGFMVTIGIKLSGK